MPLALTPILRVRRWGRIASDYLREHPPRPIVAVITLAAVLPLAALPSYELDADTAQVLYLARDFAVQGIFPLHGILNSQAAYNPPHFVWLYLLPTLALPRALALATLLPAVALNALSLYLLYRLGCRHMGPRAGLIAAVLYAFSPLGQIAGGSDWAQHILPHFYVLITFSLSEWLADGRKWSVALLLPLLAWTTGVHWGGAIAVGVTLILVLIFRPRLAAVPLMIGLLAAIVLWLPYLSFEAGRGFADIAAVAPLDPAPPGHVPADCQRSPTLTALAGHLAAPAELLGCLKGVIYAHSPFLYRTLRLVGKTITTAPAALLRAVLVNYHWYPYVLGRSGPSVQWGRYLLSLFFLGMGLGMLFRHVHQKKAGASERLLLWSFLLPLLLQSLTPYNALERPDITWLFYGPQVLVTAYALATPRWMRSAPAKGLLGVGLAVLILLPLCSAWGGFAALLEGRQSDQQRVVAYIAADVLASGHREAAIRYDFLPEHPDWRWLADFHTYDPHYRIGAEYDYLLETLYGVRNTSLAPDGMAQHPDYVVLEARGIIRYSVSAERHEIFEAGRYVVLKVLHFTEGDPYR